MRLNERLDGFVGDRRRFSDRNFVASLDEDARLLCRKRPRERDDTDARENEQRANDPNAVKHGCLLSSDGGSGGRRRLASVAVIARSTRRFSARFTAWDDPCGRDDRWRYSLT